MSERKVNSRRWLLTHALRHVPREQLDNAVGSLLWFLENGDSLVTVDACYDVLAQIAFTGGYQEPEPQIIGYVETPEPAIQDPEAPAITEEDISAFWGEMEELPDAEDPRDGFKL